MKYPYGVAELLVARAEDDRPAYRQDDRTWTWRQVVTDSARRSALLAELRRPGPFHVGIYLENVPEYLLWLGGAALAGATAVGINLSRSPAEIETDVRHTDCQLVVTDRAGRDRLAQLDLPLGPDRMLAIDDPADDPTNPTGPTSTGAVDGPPGPTGTGHVSGPPGPSPAGRACTGDVGGPTSPGGLAGTSDVDGPPGPSPAGRACTGDVGGPTSPGGLAGTGDVGGPPGPSPAGTAGTGAVDGPTSPGGLAGTGDVGGRPVGGPGGPAGGTNGPAGPSVTAGAAPALPDALPDPATLGLLLFTSGSTGAPKAVRCSWGRLASTGAMAVERYGMTPADVYYCAMPLFHGNALMYAWMPTLQVGASIALRRRFSASSFLPDVRRYGATIFNYVGKSLSYVLATPERPDDGDNPLVQGYGTEASGKDVQAFERRFGCTLKEGYGMSEGGGVAIRPTPDTPEGALGRPISDTIRVVDPVSLQECPPAAFDDAGRLTNPDAAIGEIVNTAGLEKFEGYYANPEATAQRTRNGWFWTGDLGYRDGAGFFWFAGRGPDALRVDGENFSAAPVERILDRFPDVRGAAVYAVPDPDGSDAVMAALELRAGATFDATAFAHFLAGQRDLGSKWAPTFVRLVDALPTTGTNKLDKGPLRRAGVSCDDPVWWRPDRQAEHLAYHPLTPTDRARYMTALQDRGRTSALA